MKKSVANTAILCFRESKVRIKNYPLHTEFYPKTND